jgi:hypothetical protein
MSFGATLPSIVFSAIALLLLCRFLWGAVRPGPHSPVTPGRRRILGWFVLVAGPVAAGGQYFFRYELASSLIKNTWGYRTGNFPADFNEQYSAWFQELQGKERARAGDPLLHAVQALRGPRLPAGRPADLPLVTATHAGQVANRPSSLVGWSGRTLPGSVPRTSDSMVA